MTNADTDTDTDTETKFETETESTTMDYDARRGLFRDHATTMFRGDRAESHRLQRLIYPDHRLAHHVFLQSLFVACVLGHFGDDLDHRELDRFIERLRRERPGISPLKTEALVRVNYGESALFMEVPHVDHWPCMWSAAQLIVGPDATDDHLAQLYELAESTGRDLVRGAFDSDAVADCLRPDAGTGSTRAERDGRSATARAGASTT